MKNLIKKNIVTAVILSLVIIGATSTNVFSSPSEGKGENPNIEPKEVTFYGNESSSISSSVAMPANQATLHYSGTVPPMIDEDGDNMYERYGDTKQQAIGILEKFEEDLEGKGLSMEDVTYLRVYVTPDPNKDGEIDFQGWFDAYAEFFDTEENPVKPARSTVGVAGLVNEDWLIEIEAFAAYPPTNEMANRINK
ncbi:RidA family protein [Alteribacillus sp. YIM 98480]|uniref:RidA family protein n=1 Tax=Alteribacillus sp. YIM 98480 TaxID=2606599 RepID=UPI00131CC3B8|nr:RidA family protein [Alteribacillus sp. YIM 98480]